MPDQNTPDSTLDTVTIGDTPASLPVPLDPPIPDDAVEPPAIAAELALRIATVMQAVHGLGHDAWNDHSRYNYVSADAFYGALQPHMAAARLAIRCQELECELFTVPNRDGRPMLHARFRYALGFIGYPHTEIRTIVVQILGPQSFQAAETYAKKYWLRGKFLIATGEQDDLDAEPRFDPGAAPPAPPSTAPVGAAPANGADGDAPALPAPADFSALDAAAFDTNDERHRAIYVQFARAMRDSAEPELVVSMNHAYWDEMPLAGRAQLAKTHGLEHLLDD